MNPLLSGPVVIRPGVKFPATFAFVVKGNKFSNVGDAAETVQVVVFSPVSCALSALILAAPKSLQASTMLKLQLPVPSFVHPVPGAPGIATSAGIVSTTGFVSVVRRPS